MSVEDRYYTSEEYQKLTQAQRKGLAAKRKKRGHKKGAKDSKRPGKSNQFSKREVKAMKRMLKKDNEQGDSVDSDSDNDSSDGKSKSNRNNSALKRKKT